MVDRGKSVGSLQCSFDRLHNDRVNKRQPPPPSNADTENNAVDGGNDVHHDEVITAARANNLEEHIDVSHALRFADQFTLGVDIAFIELSELLHNVILHLTSHAIQRAESVVRTSLDLPQRVFTVVKDKRLVQVTSLHCR